MNRRLGGDASLNAPVRADSEAGEWQDWLVDDTPDQEDALAETRGAGPAQELPARTRWPTLNDRERRIFEARRLAEEPATLEDLSTEFGVSRERIRQIEVRAVREGAEGRAVSRPDRRRRPLALSDGKSASR